MKLRIDGSSVRIRVRKSEVQRFAESGTVSECLAFPGGRTLTFALQAANVPEPCVVFDGGSLVVSLPHSVAMHWATGEAVGIYAPHTAGLGLIVEKDFRRTSLPSPDDADRYPNPRSR